MENSLIHCFLERKSPEHVCVQDFGGDKRDRTADLLNAIQALSQLSYTPKLLFSFAAVSRADKREYIRAGEVCQQENAKNLKFFLEPVGPCFPAPFTWEKT